MKLPEGVTFQHGKVSLWPFQREIADAISDPTIERVTLVKPVRVGFTTLLTGAIGSWVANEPSPILVLLPTEDDCRDYMVSDIEPVFEATPELNGALMGDQDERGRNTLLARRFPGGFLKLVAAKSPRNLRRHTVKVLLIDEADGMETSKEGSPLLLAERRTLQFPDRKIVVGSTPVDLDTSFVLRSYANSDQRVFEVPCVECGVFNEILFKNIKWDEGKPHTAHYQCPHCQAAISERFKTEMVAKGAWRATRPEINEGRERTHAGFRLNALISPLPNASWPQLVTEWLAAEGTPESEQPFVNTIEGRGWRGAGSELDPAKIAEAVNPRIGLSGTNDDGSLRMPEEVVLLTAGVDVQKDRLEVSIWGYAQLKTDRPVDARAKRTAERQYGLGHFIIIGSPEDDMTWLELDETLRTKWHHPLGAMIGLSAVGVDTGDYTDEAYNFCRPRYMRGVLAFKGMAGMKRNIYQRSKNSKLAPTPLHIIGVDVVKNRIFQRLENPKLVTFSPDMVIDRPDYYDQLCGERRLITYVNGQPTVRFVRKGTGIPVEALDCKVYADAARQTLGALNGFEIRLREQASQRKSDKPSPTLGDLSREMHNR
jgi:phage terminase large subunit GpA-like protein